MTNETQRLLQERWPRIEHDLYRRKNGVPLAYITKSIGFYNIDVVCSPAALVPRPETEVLVDVGLMLLKEAPLDRPIVVIDAGCGSGAVLCALLHEWRDVSVKGIAVDVSPEALDLCKINVSNTIPHADVSFVLSDWLDNVSVDVDHHVVVLSNPPYVEERDVPVELTHEPALALFGTPETTYRALFASAARFAKGRRAATQLAVEIGAGQEERVVLAADPHWTHRQTEKDLAGRKRTILFDQPKI